MSLNHSTNQNSFFRSRDWLSANQVPVFHDSVPNLLVGGQSAGYQTVDTGYLTPCALGHPSSLDPGGRERLDGEREKRLGGDGQW